jgi:hypothetical protein
MFDLLPENLYSRRAVQWGMILSVFWIGMGVFEIFHHRSTSLFPEEGYLHVGMGAVMLIIWGTRRELQPGSSESTSAQPPTTRGTIEDQANGQ